MANKCIDWYLKCENCGFEFSVLFDIDETDNEEEVKKTIRACPCGCEMKIVEEKVVCDDGE